MDCWHREIERANTEAEVVSRARDYLVLWSPDELAPVTRSDAGLRIDGASDIVRFHRRLAEGSVDARAVPALSETFSELATYFWHAAARIRELRRAA